MQALGSTQIRRLLAVWSKIRSVGCLFDLCNPIFPHLPSDSTSRFSRKITKTALDVCSCDFWSDFFPMICTKWSKKAGSHQGHFVEDFLTDCTFLGIAFCIMVTPIQITNTHPQPYVPWMRTTLVPSHHNIVGLQCLENVHNGISHQFMDKLFVRIGKHFSRLKGEEHDV